MKFENSDAEVVLNDRWNKTVVRHTLTLKALFGRVRFFSRSPVDPLQILLNYHNSVMSFITNASRRCAQYEDRAYVINYLKSARDDAVDDLRAYGDSIAMGSVRAGYKIFIHDYINQIETLFETLSSKEATFEEDFFNIPAP